ncbi:MAG: CDP-diacylglycerol/serine O-phosphatidyltransferase [Promethearchaeota archaeon CR_4]|nr:MAG: CDP-diacylglycerol/serine O-phosphatidyltransferase [Candidatus Lokiarchaeota archaeon CR_4]
MEHSQDTRNSTGGVAPHPFKIMKLKDYITLLGTFFGILAIWTCIDQMRDPQIQVAQTLDYLGNLWMAALYIAIGTGCDLLDGYVARKLNQHNDIGGELDSLSDVIVFSVAPAVFMYSVYVTQLGGTWAHPFLFLASVSFVCCGVIRLAWFNISKDAEGYVGLVVPVGALYLVMYYIMNLFWDAIKWYPSLNPIIYAITPFFIFLVGFLEISPFLTYDKSVKKKQGQTKIGIFVSIGLGIVMVICGIWFFAIAAVITFSVTVTGFLMITIYILIGFRNWLRGRRAVKEIA